MKNPIPDLAPLALAAALGLFAGGALAGWTGPVESPRMAPAVAAAVLSLERSGGKAARPGHASPEGASGRETVVAELHGRIPPIPNAGGAPPQGAATAITVDVEGVTFLLPRDWTAQYDAPGDKLFRSPDGRWTLLSFWWFPDEPLTGYDDITAVENVVVDHEPVTRIHVSMLDRHSIQNVTERARADRKRFIFTLEGEGVEQDELRAMHDALVADLHLQGGFDPSKRVDPSAHGQEPQDPAEQGDGLAAGGADAWVAYVNPRFGTRIDFPSDRFEALPPPDNGDGRTFRSVDGTVGFVVFGQYNYDDLDAPAMMARDRELGGYDRVTYERATRDWYVLSGYSGDAIFYRKVLIDDRAGVAHVFEITYPQEQRELLDPVVTRMAKAFGYE